MTDIQPGSLYELSLTGKLEVGLADGVQKTLDRVPNRRSHQARPGMLKRMARPEASLIVYGEGLDFSYAPTGAFGGFRASGRNFVCMYVKWCGRGAFEAARSDALRPVAIFEVYGTEYRGGFAAGVSHGQAFQAWCNQNGYPNAEGYFAIDQDAWGYGLVGAVGDYARGIASVIGWARTNIYAQSQVISWLHDRNLIHRSWVTYAWSGGALDPRVTLYQNPNDISVAGVSCDRDRAFQPTIGAIGEAAAPVVPPAPTGPPEPFWLMEVNA